MTSTVAPEPAVVASSTDHVTRWVGPGVDGSTDAAAPRRLATPPPVRVDPLVRQGNAFYVLVHGLLHVAAAAVAWGSLDLGIPLITMPSLSPALATVVLAALGVAFVGSAVLLTLGRGWRTLLTVATLGSAALCLVALPEAAIALGVNGLIAVGLIASRPRR
ncbi:MAG: hypothetical protein IPK37_17190 [Austwickia sp.]|jgi:hypothetical protein|nr:MAG: hypothetical protein IPK37_17190 [Austwickia sp.]